MKIIMKSIVTNLAIISMALLLSPQFINGQPCNEDDWYGLKALYDNLNGSGWGYPGWKALFESNSEPPSGCDFSELSWQTIRVDNTGRVSSVTLESVLNLAGTIPAEIDKLSNLTSLNLHSNYSISGNIPNSICNLTNLTTLQLSGNLIESFPTCMENLITLDLSGNQLTGGIPPNIIELENLSSLSLSVNPLGGEIPSNIGELENLSDLQLALTGLTGVIPSSLGNLENLTRLDLQQNSLTGTLPPQLGNLKKLKALITSSNSLSGCYDNNLFNICFVVNPSNSSIDRGNALNATWEDFCSLGLGACSPPDCNTNDWFALKALYHSTNGENWINRTGWDEQIASKSLPSSQALCNLGDLYGVTLGADGRVNGINLSNNGLSGTLAPEVASLTSLQTLILNGNQLFGCYSPNLDVHCTIANNTNISNGNNFEATWDSFCNTDLGACPNNCSDWYTLKEFYTNTDGDSWANNSGWVDHIATHNSPPTDCDFTNLHGITLNNEGRVTRIELRNNNLTGEIPYSIGTINSLSWLRLSTNNLSGSIPTSIGNLNNLVGLYLDENLLTGSIPGELGDLGSPFPVDFSDLGKFYFIWLENNSLSGCFDENLLRLCWDAAGAEEYHYIDGGNNSFVVPWYEFCPTGTGVCIPQPSINQIDLSALQALYQSTDGDNWNNRTGWDVLIANQNSRSANDNLSNLYGVTLNDEGRVIHINLAGNMLNGNLPAEIGDLPALETLWLNENQLSGAIPPQIGNLNNLSNINFFDNQLSGSIPLEIGYLNNLSRLNLKSNQLSGPVPAEIGSLVNLELLDLSRNQLTGSIPAELSNLNNLFSLNLSDNQLSGNIIATNLPPVSYLYLSNNQLTGGIPAELANLSDFQSLNLSNNQLSGCYSTALAAWCGQFNNFNISNGNSLNASFENFCNTEAGSCGICNDYLIIISSTFFQNVYQTGEGIKTQGTVSIPPNQQVEYNSKEVLLNPGFSTPASSNFEINTDGCD